MVRIEDEFGKPFYNESIISFKAFYYNCENKSTCKNSLNLNLTYCKVSNFPEKYEELFKLNNLNTAFCINFEDNPQLNGSINLSGSWSEDHISYIDFSGYICFNKSSCLSSDVLTKFLNENKIYMNFFSLEQNLNPLNYYVPEINYVKNTFLRVINNMYKVFDNFLTITNITSDIGLVNEQKNYTLRYSNQINLRDINYLYPVDMSQPFNFGTFLTFTNNKVKNVTRYYMRLQILISYVISIFNILTLIMKIIFGNIVDKYFYEDIINRFINLNHLVRKDIYLKFINENTKIHNRTNKNLIDKHNFQKINEREKQVTNIIPDNLNQNLKDINIESKDDNKNIEIILKEKKEVIEIINQSQNIKEKKEDTNIINKNNPNQEKKKDFKSITPIHLNKTESEFKFSKSKKIITTSSIARNINKFNESFTFEMSTFEYLRYYMFLCPSHNTKSKIEFYKKATELIKKYSSVENLIYYIQISKTLKNYLIRNQDKKLFNQLIKHSMIDEIGIYDKTIFSKKKN